MSHWAFVPLPDAYIDGIAWDSRKVQSGDVFFALVGENVDGHKFINSAIERGAAAVVGTQKNIDIAVPYVRIEGDDRLVMAEQVRLTLTSPKWMAYGQSPKRY